MLLDYTHALVVQTSVVPEAPFDYLSPRSGAASAAPRAVSSRATVKLWLPSRRWSGGSGGTGGPPGPTKAGDR